MAVNLSTLLFRLRANVADITPANMDDLEMLRELMKADAFIQSIKRVDVTDIALEIPLICLASYYAHATFTLLNAKQQGTIDESALLRDSDLRRVAHAQLEVITNVAITSDLTVDDTRYQKVGGIGFACSPGVMYDWRWPTR